MSNLVSRASVLPSFETRNSYSFFLSPSDMVTVTASYPEISLGFGLLIVIATCSGTLKCDRIWISIRLCNGGLSSPGLPCGCAEGVWAEQPTQILNTAIAKLLKNDTYNRLGGRNMNS